MDRQQIRVFENLDRFASSASKAATTSGGAVTSIERMFPNDIAGHRQANDAESATVDKGRTVDNPV
jgi:hypothetical protein